MTTSNWNKKLINELFEQSFNELLYQAQAVHREHFTNNLIELCTLHSIKTGRCPEDCAYCPQSGHFNTELTPEKLIDINEVIEQAKAAKKKGATRFCMGAAWRKPPKKALPRVIEMIKAVKNIGMESCVTLGMLDAEDAQTLKAAGLDYYNHNLDTSRDYYKKIISTRTYQDRINTLSHVQQAGINVCCGGIIGMGESHEDRIDFIYELTQLSQPPSSIPVNRLIPIKGTPLENTRQIDNIEFVKTIATLRIVLPHSVIRLSAGREDMTDEMQALCFLAGANSIFYGEKLLTANNSTSNKDKILLNKLGMTANSNIQTPCQTI